VERSAELPLAELLCALAERSPAPGAGCAAAWAGALAAALLEMAAAYAQLPAAAVRAPELRAQLLRAGEEDLRSYGPVLEAMRLPAGDRTRRRRLDEALDRASETPLAIARAATEVAELAAEVAAASTPALRGDATAGVLLAEAAARTGARLVEINLAGRGGDPRLVEVAALSQRAADARERTLGR
jgi:formiminotetrahydrofolate cyclodeaminase